MTTGYKQQAGNSWARASIMMSGSTMQQIDRFFGGGQKQHPMVMHNQQMEMALDAIVRNTEQLRYLRGAMNRPSVFN